MSHRSNEEQNSIFATTQWTQVLEARGESPEAKVALSDLCAAYYAPVFAFIRQNACDDDAARDLTQEFFARLLARNWNFASSGWSLIRSSVANIFSVSTPLRIVCVCGHF